MWVGTYPADIVRVDRNNIAAAKLAGLQEELNLSSVEFETAVSILFVGYLLMQIPSNLLLNKFGKPAIYLPSCMILWGIISTATAGCKSAGGLFAVRFFLGFVEAAYFPGCKHSPQMDAKTKSDLLAKACTTYHVGTLAKNSASGPPFCTVAL